MKRVLVNAYAFASKSIFVSALLLRAHHTHYSGIPDDVANGRNRVRLRSGTVSPLEALEAWERRRSLVDFSVEEISLDGVLASFADCGNDSLWVPGSKPPRLPTPTEQKESVAALLNSPCDPLLANEELVEALGFAVPSTANSLREEEEAGAASLSSLPFFIPVGAHVDKEARSQFHQQLRMLAGTLVDSKTETAAEGGSVSFKVWRKATPAAAAAAAAGGKGRGGSGGRWDPSMKEYLRFVLKKQGVTTLDAVDELAARLHCKAERFAYSGAKDKVAATAQFVTLWRPPSDAAERLALLLESDDGGGGGGGGDRGGRGRGRGRTRGGGGGSRRTGGLSKKVVVGRFEQFDAPLRLGGLSGNRFRITLRGLVGESEEEEENEEEEGGGGEEEQKAVACEEARGGGDEEGLASSMLAAEKAATEEEEGGEVAALVSGVRHQALEVVGVRGFLNSFGSQRFGVAGDNAHVGSSMLRGRFDEAVVLILHRVLTLESRGTVASDKQSGGENSSSSSSSDPVEAGEKIAIGKASGGGIVVERVSETSLSPPPLSSSSPSLSPLLSASPHPLGETERGKGGVRDRLDEVLDDDRGQGFNHLTSTERKLLECLGRQRRAFLRNEDHSGDDHGGDEQEPTRRREESVGGGGVAVCCYDAERALADALPRSLRRLYVESWQSQVWNALAAHRVTNNTRSAASGNDAGDSDEEDEADQQQQQQQQHAIEGDLVFDVRGNGDGKGGAREAAGLTAWDAPLASKEAVASAVHSVTRQEAQDRVFTLQDVCLPLLGTEVELPSWVTEELLACYAPPDLLALATTSGGVKRRELELKGSYRHVVVVPRNVSVTVEKNAHSSVNVFVKEGLSVETEKGRCDSNEDNNGDGKKSGRNLREKVTQVRFDLPPASYATVCIRNILTGA